MVGSITGGNSYLGQQVYRSGLFKQAPAVLRGQSAPQPGAAVEPVIPVRAVHPDRSGPTILGPVIREGADPAEMAVRMRIQPSQDEAPQGVEGVQKTVEEGECQTCKERKYQDGSDDAGVSFKTPTRVAPERAASAVRSHEMEHVTREQAKAQREDRRVVSQSVTYHTAICPECGKAYVSGGTTRTTTASITAEQPPSGGQDRQGRIPFSAVA